MKTILWSLMIVFMAACSAVKPTITPAFEGKWKEQWGKASATDVVYKDVYEVSKQDGQLVIACSTHRHYRFQEIKAKKQQLSFVLVNEDQKYGSGTVTIRYALTLVDGKLLGKATNSEGKIVDIEWHKQ
jgi:hypothetical protein